TSVVQPHGLPKYLIPPAFPPPRRKAARFSGLVKEDDVAVGIAQPRFAPHPRLVARAMLERNPAPPQLLDALIEIVAFEVDRSGRDDLLFGVDLDRERHSAGSLEASVVRRIADDLLEAELFVEGDRPVVIGAGDGHLVEAGAGADIEANTGLADRPPALAQPRCVMKCDSNEFARPCNGIGKRAALGKEERDRACERAARTVGAGRIDPRAL